MTTHPLPEPLSSYLEHDLPALLEKHNIPGAGVVLVKENEILFKQGYGMRNLEQASPVTTRTLFAIGSTSKAFTATVLGTLVDEGKLKWDDPVAQYIPEFRCQDSAATLQLTVRDILCHRSGLPRHDIAWLLSHFSRAELLDHIRHFQPFAPIRSRFHYNNFMWLVAGIIAERITGKTWEENVRERIFVPLGIEEAVFSVDEMQRAPDYALPYQTIDGQVKRVAYRNLDSIGPAGSINAHVEDYARWLMLNINQGEYSGQNVISAESLAEIHNPQMAMPVDDELAAAFRYMKEFSDLVYTLGWVSVQYRGRRMIMHAGGIDGFAAFIAFFPNEKIGVGVLTNSGGITSHYGIAWEILDRYFGDAADQPAAWVDLLAGLSQMGKDAEEQSEEQYRHKQVKFTQPSHPILDYCGVFFNPAYGTLQLGNQDGLLCGDYNGFPITLEHYHYDIFRLTVHDGSAGFKFPLTFVSNLDGRIDKIQLPLEAKVTAIEFLKKE